jgi:beta-glucosidase
MLHNSAKKNHLSLVNSSPEGFIDHLVQQMNIHEKLGQMSQFAGLGGWISDDFANDIRSGAVGSVLNETDANVVNELQRLAVEESRLGIPLLIGRDVIHGFKTIFPIPLGQAASWSPEVIKQGARVAAAEAATCGVNWTFAPMIDISRDPRWGRVAESLGEDPYLCSRLGVAMVEGFQGDSLNMPGSIAACAKHFAGYGAAESGRDYATTNIPENELRNVYLPPFKAAADAGAATFMAAFSDLNGVPASGNEWLMNDILREEWQYDGMVVSDWDSIHQLTVHGFTANDQEAAFEAANAGIDMEMVSKTYAHHLGYLVEQEKISSLKIDKMVSRILRAKFDLGLFENPYARTDELPELLNTDHLSTAKDAAIKSCVLLKNTAQRLPLVIEQLNRVSVIGPLADDGYEQLGTWIFDGEAKHSTTFLQAFKKQLGDSVELDYVRAMQTSRSNTAEELDAAVNSAANSDLAVMVLGEESILSGEAHSRADINLPGCQVELIEAIERTGTPIVLVIMAGRPLTLENVVNKVDSILYAWHPGTMGGEAIADLLLGKANPSGKLPITFPRTVGQVPLYYAQKNSGKPASDQTFLHMNDIPVRAEQTSLGMTATHLDTHFSPLFPFGFGLSYSQFDYAQIQVDQAQISLGQHLTVSAQLTNSGDFAAEEVVQLYIRDLVGNVTRPIKELKGFQRVKLLPGESVEVKFDIHTDDLAFYDRKMEYRAESGMFHVWIGGSSDTEMRAEFEIL